MQKVNISRKEFITSTSFAGSGLLLGFLLPGIKTFAQTSAPGCDFFQPNTFLKIDTKGLITVYVGRQEMGQGVNTSLPMVVAEELDADWRNVKVEIAPFGTLPEGAHDTGGSQSVLTD
ncbi:MAG TPA: molybdopterin cofactor-binding domain-containing protein, partial [Lacibacter sp.]|nr:molybdopterin cofactor-binding domain-containing protein [Lacibacter sp.]